MIRVAVLDDYQRVAREYGDWSTLSNDAEIVFFHDHLAETDAIIARLREFDVVCLNRERTPVTRALIDGLPKLKLIVTLGHANASIDMKAAAERGVLVCGSSPDQTQGASELTWGLILALLRHIPTEMQSIRSGGWTTTVGFGLKGRTLGLLGLGKSGSQVAKVARAFDMKLIAWSQNLTAERAAQHGAQLVSKDDLFATADVLTVHLRLSDRSREIVGAREIGLMKKTAFLINTARGPIVDEAALVDALRQRRIAGAALDVFDVEPLPADHPLRRLDNVVVSPHIGGVIEERYSGRFRDMVEDVRAWLDGKPIRQLGPNGRLPA